jgi:hypothetical protein
MNKSFWALAGIALLGTAGVSGLLVASSGGEEEVAQQVETATPVETIGSTPTSTATATSPAPIPDASPQPIPADWLTYTNPILGLSFPYPPQLTMVEERSERGLEGQENQRVIVFRTAQAETGLALQVIPVGDVALKEWVDFYTACGGDASAQEVAIEIAGQEALRCPIDQLNQGNPGHYLKWGSYIVEITGNLAGSREGGYLPSVLTKDEMQMILDGFTLPTADLE